MKLFEHEGKELYRKYNIPTPEGIMITNSSDVDNLTIEKPVVIKAQVLQGGRGKAGGIKKANDKQTAIKAVQDILNKPLKNEIVSKVLIEEQVRIKQEIYVAITIDDVEGLPILIASAEGGMEIEELAKTCPDEVIRKKINPIQGLSRHQCISFIKQMGLTGKALTQVSDVCFKLYKMFKENDAIVAEINPLVITEDEKVIALDSKFEIDDSALFRQKDFDPESHLESLEDPYERMARSKGFTFVNMEGNVAVISAGAGFTMTVLDLIQYYGGKPANFADMIGGAGPEVMEQMGKLILQKAEEDANIKSILFNITLSATPLESVIDGLSKAFENRRTNKPIVGCVRATDAAVINMDLETAKKIMYEKGVTMYDNIKDTVKAAVEYTKKGLVN